MSESEQVVVFAANLLAGSKLAEVGDAKQMLVSSGPTGKRDYELGRCYQIVIEV